MPSTTNKRPLTLLTFLLSGPEWSFLLKQHLTWRASPFAQFFCSHHFFFSFGIGDPTSRWRGSSGFFLLWIMSFFLDKEKEGETCDGEISESFPVTLKPSFQVAGFISLGRRGSFQKSGAWIFSRRPEERKWPYSECIDIRENDSCMERQIT